MNETQTGQTVNFNGLLMQYVGGNTLFCADEGAIIDWLSQFNYPREFLTIDSTNTVVFYRDGLLDLVIANNFQKEGEKGLTVSVWLDFVGQRTDLRYLGRPYDEAHQAQYHSIWDNINQQIRHIGQHRYLHTIAFIQYVGGAFQPHFRFVDDSTILHRDGDMVWVIA